MKKMNLVAVAVAASLAAAPALSVEFFGYFRAGTALSTNGTGDANYEKQKVGRLGNENDNYSEFGFRQDLQTGDKNWRVEAMLNNGNSGTNAPNSGGTVGVAQFNVQATGVLGFDKEATVWAGKRYYQRKDVHITDFYFLNTSGTGGGIENISVGNQKLSFALIDDTNSSQDTGKQYYEFDSKTGEKKLVNEKEEVKSYTADVRLANIGLWEDATLEIAGAYNFGTGTASGNTNLKADDGALVTAILHQNMTSGFNQTVVQYGNSSYGAQMADLGNGGSFDRRDDANNDAQGVRVLNWGVVSLSENWEMGHQFLAARSTDAAISSTNRMKSDHDLVSAVIRPMYQWTDSVRTIFEAGAYQENYSNAGNKKGSKFTVAQAFSMGEGFFARPEIRVYGTYLDDRSDSAQLSDKSKKKEFLMGVQVEAWF
ncbi:carbohydrate porin [Vibrio sp. ZSDZ34]|uniref:Carbohydrate porin n=1 Tax=Vibrio gelatinilyticus TaxID=2893468 RepID=A0A9X2AWS9_9VIBR|nr:carbohydrate porin [Vibrio gelatinilyticus]MCJ2377621.1 carbohydrate porin [Vibrio gelatinilyticus]